MNHSLRLRLYLIRHGELEAAAAGKLIGRTDAALSEYGIEQAQRLAAKLAFASLDAVYSSDLQRARRTAEIIAVSQRLAAQPSEVWREIDMGLWEGRTLAAVHEETPESVASLFNAPGSFKYPDGESFADFTGRIKTALERLLQMHPKGEIALVVHGGVCRAIIGDVLEIPIQNWLRVAQGYGCLNVITWYESYPRLELLNYDSDESPRVSS